MGDVLAGDPPVNELSKTGGVREAFAYGGEDFGRGLRSSRFVGAVKLMAQQELRADIIHFDVLGNDLGLGAAAFFDVGDVAADIAALGHAPPQPAFGGGLGTRIAWNHNFVQRLDLAMSPTEGPRVAVYTALGQTF